MLKEIDTIQRLDEMARPRRSSRLKGETPKSSTTTERDGFAAYGQHGCANEMPDFPPIPTATPSGTRKVSQQQANANTPSTHGSLKPSPKDMHPQLYHSSTKNQTALLGSESNNHGDCHNVHTSPSHLRTQQTSSPFTSQTFGFNTDRIFMGSNKGPEPNIDAFQHKLAAIRKELARETPCGDREQNQDHGAAIRRVTRSARKAGRFSDAHKRQFNKMDSISSHTSNTRTTPIRTIQSASKALKRSRSEIELGSLPNTVKISKFADKSDGLAISEAVESPAKRLRMGYAQMSSRKSNDKGISQASTVRTANVPSPSITQLSRPILSSSAKTSTPLPSDLRHSQPTSTSNPVPTPTRRLGRMEYVSPKINTIKTPTKVESVMQHAQTDNSHLHKFKTPFKSILRKEPSIRFSNDPAKLAAGTHVSTPKSAFADLSGNVTAIATPSSPSHRKEKHVVFSPEPEIFDVAKRSYSPATTNPAGKVGFLVSYPVLKGFQATQSPISNIASPSETKRSAAVDKSTSSGYKSGGISLAFSPNATRKTNTGDFTFRHDNRIKFAPVLPLSKDIPAIKSPSLTPTNRRVADTWSTEQSNKVIGCDAKASTARTLTELPNVPHGISNKKRKRDATDDEEDGVADGNKENKGKQQSTLAKAIKDEKVSMPPKPAKRVKPSPAPSTARAGPVTKPARQSQASNSKGSSGTRNNVAARAKSVLSLSRLNALAQPKQRK